MEIKKGERFYAKINLEFDSEKIGQPQRQEITGDEVTIASLIGSTLHYLLEHGFDRKVLEHAIQNGLNESKKEKQTKKIQVKEIHLNDGDAEELKNLLKKLKVMGD